MKVVVGGQGWLAVRACRLLAALVDTGHLDASVEIVPNADDRGVDTWLPSLRRLGLGRTWPVHERPEAAGLGSGDLFLSLQFDRIVDCAGLGGAAAVNLHFSALPRYRGSLTSVWPLRRGETETGVTLHVLTPGIDAGPVIATARFGLPVFLTAFQLYRAYHDHGFELLKDNLPALLARSYAAEPQDERAADMIRRSSVDFADTVLRDFDGSSEQVRDHCRSLIFDPRQRPMFQGRPIAACYALPWLLIDGAGPGAVLQDDGAQILVACAGGAVCLELVTGG